MSKVRGPLNSADIPEPQPVGGVFNSTPPAPLDGQGCTLQLDANGRLLVSSTGGGSASTDIFDSSGNVLNSNGAGALNVAVVSGGGSNASVGLNGVAAPTSSTQAGGSDGVNLQPLQVDASKNLKVIVNAALPAGTNVIGHVITDTGSTTAVTGNVTVVQPTASALNAQVQGAAAADAAASGNPVLIAGVDNAGNVQELGVADTATTAPAQTLSVGGTFNTTPATLTSGQIGALQLDAAENLLVNLKTAIPAGANVIGHVIADSGSTTAVTGNVTVVQPTGTNLHVVVDSSSGTSTVAGNLTNNNAAPAANNVGVLPALANAANPSWTEGDQVLISVDLSGHQRVVATGAAASGSAVAGNPVLIGGKNVSGNAQTFATSNTGIITTVQNLSPTDALGNNNGGFVIDPTGNQNALVIFPFIFNGTTWDRQRSGGATGAAMVAGAAAADAAASGNPVLIAGVDAAGNIQELPVADAESNTPSQTLLTGGAVTTAAPTYTTGKTDPLSLDTAGNLRVLNSPATGSVFTVAGNLTNNNAAPAATEVGVLPALANAASPSWTEGDQVLESVDLTGRQRVRGTLTHNAAAPTADLVGAMVGLVSTAAPAYTAGDVVLLSVDALGNTRVKGAVQSTIAQSAFADNKLQVNYFGDASSTTGPLIVADEIYGGAFSGAANAAKQGWSKRRTSTVFNTVQATAAGNTAIWTPGAGNKFRLLAFRIESTANASLAAGAVNTISFQDSASGMPFAVDVFIPTTAVTTTQGAYDSGWITLGDFGFLSAAANNVLNVNVATAYATGNARIMVAGTEE